MKEVEAQIGKYNCKAYASQLPGGKFAGNVAVRWEENHDSRVQLQHYGRAFDTEEEAVQHALAQIELQANAGNL